MSFLRSLFGPWSYGRGRGRVHVVGCAPGCILASIAISLFVTLLLNGCLRAFT